MFRHILSILFIVLFWVGFPFLVKKFYSSIKRSARSLQPHEEGSSLEFVVIPRMRYLVDLIVGLLLGFAILITVVSARRDEGVYAALIPLAVAVLILLFKPVPVVVDHDGVRQSRWFLADKAIAWPDVAWVRYGPNTGTLYVKSKKGSAKIRFSAFLVGRKRFEHEIRNHVGDTDTIDTIEDD